MAPKRQRVVSAGVAKAEQSSKRAKTGTTEAEGQEEQTLGKAKKVRKNKRDEKAADAVTRLVAIGQEWSDENDNLRKWTDIETQASDGDWVERIAQYLVREDKYQRFMQNPPQKETVFLMKRWVAAIHLPRRWLRFEKFDSFWNNWLEPRRLTILQRALDVYDAAVGVQQKVIHDTEIQPPDNSQASIGLRQYLFAQHSSRRTMIAAVKSCIDLEHQIMRKITMCEHGSEQMTSTIFKDLVAELQRVEACKEELRAALKNTEVIKRGRVLLDDLLAKVPSQSLLSLSRLDANAENKRDNSHYEEKPLDHTAIRQKLDSKFSDPGLDYNPSDPGKFYGDTDQRGSLDLNDVFKVNTPRKWPQADISKHSMLMQDIEQMADFETRDSTVADQLEKIIKGVDLQRFTLNMHFFEDITTRPTQVANAKPSSSGIFLNPAKRELVLFDNIFHVRWFADALQRNDMLPDGQETRKALRRMWAVVALMYGCITEGGMLLELMDAMLEDLAELVVGNVDPRYQTETMVKFQNLRTSWDLDAINNITFSEEDRSDLERKDKARGVFNELARFYHGAIVLVYTDVSWGSRNAESAALSLNWYESLLRFCHECPNEDCNEVLKVFDNRNARNNKWGLSVGVRDGRKGLPENRPEFSIHNRAYAYGCLYELIHWTKWHEGHGVFFHYFAHLYHTACQPTRGKDSMIKSIDISKLDAQKKAT